MAAITSRDEFAERYSVEPMLASDLAEVSAVDARCFSRSWPLAAYRQELRHPERSHYIVLRAEPVARFDASAAITERLRPRLTLLPFGKKIVDANVVRPIVGFAGMWVMFDEAHITTIGIDPNWQGNGLGELLICALFDAAIERGAGFVSLEVRISNRVAQAMYEKYRFSVIGVREEYYTDNWEDALLMRSDRLDSDEYRVYLNQLRAELRDRLAGRAFVPDLNEPLHRGPIRQ